MIKEFFVGIAFGIIMAVQYDFIRLFKIIFSNKFLNTIFDIIFMLCCCIINFCYLLSYNNGQVRILLIILELFGFLLYISTVSTQTIRIQRKISGVFRKIVAKTRHLFAKRQKNRKKVLQKSDSLLYNRGNRVLTRFYPFLKNTKSKKNKIKRNLKQSKTKR